jgi:hypothetical protein
MPKAWMQLTRKFFKFKKHSVAIALWHRKRPNTAGAAEWQQYPGWAALGGAACTMIILGGSLAGDNINYLFRYSS